MFEQRRCQGGLPERIRSGPSCDLMRRMPAMMSGARPSNGPYARLSGLWVATYLVAALIPSAIGLLGAFGQKPDQIVGATAKRQIEALAILGEDRISASGGPIGRGPVALAS